MEMQGLHAPAQHVSRYIGVTLTYKAVHLHTQVSSPNRDPLYTRYRHARFGRKRRFRKVATGLLVHET